MSLLCVATSQKDQSFAYNSHVTLTTAVPNNRRTQQIVHLSLFAILIAGVAGLLRYVMHVPFVHPLIAYILLWVFAQMFVSLWIIHTGVRNSPQAVVRYALLATVVRLVLSMIVIFIALQQGVDQRVSFVLNFLTVYFAFLVFELISLLTTLRANLE